MTPREWECGRKIRYTSLATARTIARKARRTRAVKLSPYNCYYCGLYHVGKRSA